VSQLIRIVATILLTNFAVIVGVRVLAQVRQPITALRDLLYTEGCITTCWQTIQPALTNRTAVRDLLDTNGIEFVFARSSGDQADSFVWQLPNSSPLAYPSEVASVVVEFDTEDVVWRVAVVTLDVCFSRVIDAFGIPPFANGDEHLLRLGYPDEGLVFGVNLDTDRVTGIFITTDAWVRYFSQLATRANWEALKDDLSSPCVDRFST
jgi:hypothetical protein